MPHSTPIKNKRRRTNPSVPVAQPEEFIKQIKTSEDDQDSVEYWKRKYFQMLRTCGELRSILKVRDFQIDKYREMLGLPPQVKVGYVSPNAANSNLEQSWHWREMKQENVSDDDDDVSMNANPDSEVNSVTDDDDDNDNVNKSDLIKDEANSSKTAEKIEAFAQIGNDVVKSSRARKSGRIRKPSLKKGKAVTMTRRVQSLSKGIKRKGRSTKTTNKNKLKSIRKNNSSSSSPSVAAATKAATATSSSPELKFTCKICSKEFSTEMSLEKHGKFHLPDRQFECPECHQRFKHKVHMKVHLRTHTGAKPYNCKHCKKEFTQMANMVYHVRNHHPGKTS